VLISSDLPEVMSQSDRVGVFRAGRLVATRPARQTTAEEVAALAFPGEGEEREQEKASARRTRGWALPPEWGLAGFVALLFMALHLATGRFLQADSVRSLATEAALLGFCATGAMLVLLAGGLDISLGALMALSAGVAGELWEKGQPLPLVLLAAAGVGAAGGALNATLSLVGRVHPIVITLGTMSVYRGLALWWLGQDVQIGLDRRAWAMADLLGVPVVAWLGLLLAVFTAAWLQQTVSGRELYALGSNPRAAHRVGIRPARVWLTAFTLEGVLAGLAGLLYLARSGSIQPTSHEDRTLEAIAAAVVGGVAITGGRGSVLGLAVGCLLLVSLGPACIFLGLSPLVQQSLVGAVLLAAVLLDALVRRRSA
jgi:ribose/xylose/arabinose/galactoside ABC-type transport system permease subunit